MKITYIEHSCFLIETENSYMLFDYFKGELPIFNNNKNIYVFSSHKHYDHFHESVLELHNKYDKVTYIFSNDIKFSKKYNPPNILYVKPHNNYTLTDNHNNELHIQTLRSTDEGVAFIVKYASKTYYHAGDLNLWMWKEESKQYNNNMKALFEKEMEYLQNVHIDVAFVPLDPRQEDYYDLGIIKLIKTAKIRYLFPMHLWDQYDLIDKFISMHNDILKNADVNLVQLNHKIQTSEINL